jgi:hypothetical protein
MRACPIFFHGLQYHILVGILQKISDFYIMPNGANKPTVRFAAP